MDTIYVRIEKDKVSYGGITTKRNLKSQFNQLKEILKESAL